MSDLSPGIPEKQMSEKEMQEQIEKIQEQQRLFLEREFAWLIEFVASYFPEDKLALEDALSDIHFIHLVVDGGKPLGALVYRFPKVLDKAAYFAEIGEEYREGLEVPEVLFVDSQTAKFEAPSNLEGDGNLLEIPHEKLTGKIRDLREELKRRARLRQLRESL
jgi:hypothetical protein